MRRRRSNKEEIEVKTLLQPIGHTLGRNHGNELIRL